jgi:hypothetical protein
VPSAVPVLAGLSLVLACLPAGAQTTTPIPILPHHGAMVTVEQGVRVFRPLPHTRPINPDATQQAASNQSEHCAGLRTYLYQVGNGAGFSRYLRRVEGRQLLR